MIWRLILFSAWLALSGCATTPLLEPSTDPHQLDLWQQHQARLQSLQHWRVEGRAAILARGSGGQVAFAWQREPGQQTLSIRTPLGQNVMQLTQTAQGVVLIDPEGTIHQGNDGEALLREILGWSVPLESMHAWLRGLPASRKEAFLLDEHGRIKLLQSNGWRIEYQRYSLIQGLALPSRLELTHTDLTLRLVVDRWRL